MIGLEDRWRRSRSGGAVPCQGAVLQGVGGVSCDMASHLRLDGFGSDPLTSLFRRGCEGPLGPELAAMLDVHHSRPARMAAGRSLCELLCGLVAVLPAVPARPLTCFGCCCDQAGWSVGRLPHTAPLGWQAGPGRYVSGPPMRRHPAYTASAARDRPSWSPRSRRRHRTMCGLESAHSVLRALKPRASYREVSLLSGHGSSRRTAGR